MESTKDTLIYLLQPFKVSSKFEAICASAMSGNRISGLYSKLCESNVLTRCRRSKRRGQRYTTGIESRSTSILEMTKVLGLSSSAIQAVVPPRLQTWNLQQLVIQSLKLKKSFEINVKLTALVKEELLW